MTGDTVRAAMCLVALIVVSACASEPTDQSADAKVSPATTGTTVDFFATTIPDLAAVVPADEAPTTTAVTTTEAPATTSTAADDSNRSRSGGPNAGADPGAPESGSSGRSGSGIGS